MPQEKIQILFTRFDKEFDEEKLNRYMSLLPEEEIKRANRYTNLKGKTARLIGRLLLIDGLKTILGETVPPLKLTYNDRGRPEIRGEIDFNISHSGEYVVCALSTKGRVGIDIEKIRDIKWDKFSRWVPSSQWIALHKSSNPNDDFFSFWSINEAILKGNGGGLTAISELRIADDKKSAVLKGEEWFIEEIKLDEGYSCHLACNKQNTPYTIKERYY